MKVSRRDFLKILGATTAGGLGGILGFNAEPALARVRDLKISKAKVGKAICTYCSVLCGLLIYSLTDGAKNVKGRVMHIEGDPDNAVNRGSLCPKGANLKDLLNSPNRITKPLYRAPGATEWREISWEEAIEKWAKWIKDTRDRTFVEKNDAGKTVNRCESIFWLSGSQAENEVTYLWVKIARVLGLTNLEVVARI